MTRLYVKLTITTKELPDYYTVERIKEELYAIEYEMDQPIWMCGYHLMNKWVLKRRKLLTRLRKLTGE